MPFNSFAGTRDLNYPLDRSLVPIADTTNETIADPQLTWQSTDNNERVNIVLNLSLNEFVGVASCIDVGSDIAYGEDALVLWWTWIRSFNMVDVCDLVSDCIANNPGTQEALTLFIQNSGIGDPNFGNPDIPMMPFRFSDAALDTEIAPPPAGCDLDILWAGIREIVDRLDDNGRDFLEDLQVILDKVERVNGMIALVPIVGSVASAAINQFTEIIPDVLNLYNAYSSEAVKDDIACDLFELVCSECRYPTFREIMDYYANLGIPGLNDYVNLAVSAAMSAASTLIGFSGLLVYHSIITFQLFFMYLGAKFNLANDESALGLWASLGEDFPSDNWIALCGGCAGPPVSTGYTINFATIGALPSEWTVPNGTFINGVGVESVNISGLEGVNILVTVPANFTFNRFSLEYTRQGDNSINDFTRILSYLNPYPSTSGRQTIYHVLFGTQAQGTHFECPPGFITPTARKQFLFQLQDSNLGLKMVMKKIRLWNNDDSPVNGFTNNSESVCLA